MITWLNKLFYYIDNEKISGFFLLLKNHIFIAPSEDRDLSFTCEDIGVTMVTNMISQLLSLFLLYNFISEFHNIFVAGILRYVTTLIALFCCFENEQKKGVFYVGISSVSIK